MRLSPRISFRNYPDFCILLNHADGRIMRLNSAAGRILETLDRGGKIDDPEGRAFLDTLAAAGLLETAPGESDFSPKTDAPSPSAKPPRLFRELKETASRNLWPVSAQLELTYRCPLNCRHCYLHGEKVATSDERSTAEWKSVMDGLADLGTLFLVFTGGEPFLRPDFDDLFFHARKRRFAVSILTSGMGVDADRIRRLATRGIDEAQVSLHHIDAKNHDEFVGIPGAYDAAWRALLAFRDAGVSVRAAIGVTKRNLDVLEQMKEKLKENGILWNFNLNLLPFRDGDIRVRDELQADAEELRPILLESQGNSERRLATLSPDDPPCNAGRALLSIDPFGGVHPCLMMRNDCGNVKDRPLREIWEHSPVLEEVRALRIRDLVDCPECPDRAHCNRCPGLARMEGKSIRDHSVLDCGQACVLSSFHSSR